MSESGRRRNDHCDKWTSVFEGRPEIEVDRHLIKLKAAGICGSDVQSFEGKSAEGRYDLGPYTHAHEWAGEVAVVGNGVTDFAVGDKVTAGCVMNCFKCENCKQGLMPAACLNFLEAGFRPDSPGGGASTCSSRNIRPQASRAVEIRGGRPRRALLGRGLRGLGASGWVDAADDVVVFRGGMIGCASQSCVRWQMPR